MINDQKKLLEERNTRVQQAAKIREQKKKIDELNIELARALTGNERLQELLNPKTSHKGAQRIAYAISRRALPHHEREADLRIDWGHRQANTYRTKKIFLQFSTTLLQVLVKPRL